MEPRLEDPYHPRRAQGNAAGSGTDPDTNLSQQLTWTVLPQGFRDGPCIFRQALAADLSSCPLQPSLLLQPYHCPKKSLSSTAEGTRPSRETADKVASLLTQEIIPRFGLPANIQSDNGPAFTTQVVQLVTKSLNISWKLHIPYHPQSLAKVERAHGILKGHLAKLTIEVKPSWPILLPLALAWVRATTWGPTGLSPFEWLY
nr:uncharacterized protein LOC104652422 [Saimiri boliviensis boliviensis]